MLFKWILSFLGRSELPKREKEKEEQQCLMDNNLTDKGFYFVLLWFLIKPFIVLFNQKNSLIKIILVRPLKIFKLLVNTSNK